MESSSSSISTDTSLFTFYFGLVFYGFQIEANLICGRLKEHRASAVYILNSKSTEKAIKYPCSIRVISNIRLGRYWQNGYPTGQYNLRNAI